MGHFSFLLMNTYSSLYQEQVDVLPHELCDVDRDCLMTKVARDMACNQEELLFLSPKALAR